MTAKKAQLDKDAKIYLAGHTGLAGSAILKALSRSGYSNIVTARSKDLDLTDRAATFDFISSTKPDCVIVAAAKVGGILANRDFPADFLSQNLQIQTNIMDASSIQRTQRLLFLGSSCIYPRNAKQPISEDQLLTGELEDTNSAYAIAKIAGLIQVESVRKQFGLNWISAMPTNLYGYGDNFDAGSSHVFAALVKRYVDAKNQKEDSVTNWGTGLVRREFLSSDDLADAIIFLLNHYDSGTHINVGTGIDIEIRELAQMIAQEVGFEGETYWDKTKPDGTPRKLLSVSKINALGWKSKISLSEGIKIEIDSYQKLNL